MERVKRDRSANFSLHETDILVSVILKHQAALENKQSDASSWKMKEAAWKSIETEFNSRSGGVYRTKKTLKIKYEGLKRTVRKKSAVTRSEFYRTGGQSTAPTLDNAEEKIKSLITDGRQNTYDSDVIENQGSPLETPTLDGGTAEVLECGSTQNEAVLLETPSKKSITTPSSSTRKWDVTSRRNLKTRRHPILTANVPTRTLLDQLTQAKLDLVQLQRSFLEEEIKEKKKVWEFEQNERKKETEFKEKERKWKEEEYKFKLQNNFK